MKLQSSFDLMFQRNLWDITDNQKAFVIMEKLTTSRRKFHMGTSAGVLPIPWLFLPFLPCLSSLLQMFGGRGATKGSRRWW